uniref:Growth-regulating factor n=1 Tax=Daucus carota subsp. sativus TaxID=79200 RepID=A0A166FFQ5_DAUCS
MEHHCIGVNLVKKNYKGKEGAVKDESKFGLGICADVRPVISVNQLQELHQQVVIFNYIASGVDIPSKLVGPIWKRVASSVLGSVGSGISSSFSSYIRPRGITYKSLMDPEPGRCRRTDGNKWRCRKDVIPNAKYCERHMHRGRSRKRVETSNSPLQLNTPKITYPCSSTPTITFSRKASQKIKSHDHDDAITKVSTPDPEKQQKKIPSSNESKGLTCSTTAVATFSANGKSKTAGEFVEKDKSSSRENSDSRNGVNTGSGDNKNKNDKGNSTNGDKNGGPVTPELSISAKSVVDSVTVSSFQVYEHRGVTADETQRCKRTDGKRWRCSKEAIPQQKYCDSHMHRGSKRCKSSSKAEIVTAASEALASISAVKCAQPTVVNLDSSTSGSSSDAATVTDTDENTSASHILPLPS